MANIGDLESPENWSDDPNNPDSAVNAARLTNAIDGATLRAGAIGDRTTTTPASIDELMFLDVSAAPSGGSLVKNTLANLVGAIVGTGTSAANLPAVRILGTTSVQAAPGNDSRFPATVTGIRKGAGAGSTDTAANSSDYATAPTQFTLAAGAATLACTSNLRFYGTLDANATLTLNPLPPDGSTLILQITQDGTGSRTLTFVAAGMTQTREGGTGAVSTAAASVTLVYMERFGTQLRRYYRNAFS